MPRKKLPLKACVRCKTLVPENVEVCPNCGSTEFSDYWEGLVIIIDKESSEVAKILSVERDGMYAIKVR